MNRFCPKQLTYTRSGSPDKAELKALEFSHSVYFFQYYPWSLVTMEIGSYWSWPMDHPSHSPQPLEWRALILLIHHILRNAVITPISFTTTTRMRTITQLSHHYHQNGDISQCTFTASSIIQTYHPVFSPPPPYWRTLTFLLDHTY